MNMNDMTEHQLRTIIREENAELEERLEKKLDAKFDKKLDEKLKDVVRRDELNQALNALEKRLDKRIDEKLDAKLEINSAVLFGQITRYMDQRFEAWRAENNTRILFIEQTNDRLAKILERHDQDMIILSHAVDRTRML